MYVFCHLFLCTTTKIYSIPHKNFTLVIQVHTVPTASSDPSCTQSTLQFSANTIHVNEHYVCLRSVLITFSYIWMNISLQQRLKQVPRNAFTYWLVIKLHMRYLSMFEAKSIRHPFLKQAPRHTSFSARQFCLHHSASSCNLFLQQSKFKLNPR